MATVDDFLALDLRVGTIVSADILRGARRKTYMLGIDLGTLGVLSSTAEITDLYEASEIVGLQVVALVNIPSQAVAGLQTQVQILTVDDGKGAQVLVIPERPVPDGRKIV